MKKMWIVLFLMLTACVSVPHRKDPAVIEKPAVPWLHTEGNRIVDQNGEIRILLGVNRSGFEYDTLGNQMNREEIDFICQEWKSEIIRVPFNQEWMIPGSPYMCLLDSAIQWIAANHAYAMLDLQWENREVRISKIPDEASVSMWRMVADKYKSNPAVLYDLHNEPHDTTWEAWRGRAVEIIEAIREVHPRSLIFVGGLDWAYDLRGWQENPLPYKNIVYSTHPYPHKAEAWAWDKYFGTFSEQLPVFAGEFGFGANNISWGTQLIKYLENKKIGWTAWSWVDHPKITQNDRRTPTEFGSHVRKALLKHAGIREEESPDRIPVETGQ